VTASGLRRGRARSGGWHPHLQDGRFSHAAVAVLAAAKAVVRSEVAYAAVHRQEVWVNLTALQRHLQTRDCYIERVAAPPATWRVTVMVDASVARMGPICYIDAMKYETALDIIGDDALFETGLLLAGVKDPRALQRQLPRWVRSGKLLKLRRGLYAVPAPHRTRPPDPFEVSNRLVRPSFVSMESALHFHEVIPDVPFGVTAVTTGRTGTHDTTLGTYVYHHVGPFRFWGFDEREIAPGRRAYVATPERALLDLLYARRGSEEPAYLRQLRLQNLERLDSARLDEMARRFGVERVRRAARAVRDMTVGETLGWVTL
jgi:hypothetical protein